jgi:methyl-accepting chemotaxis protein
VSFREDVRSAIAAELRACEERVRALIDAATTLSEREIVTIGTRIAEMNREAAGNLDALTGLSSEFQSGQVQGRASLEAAVRGQTGVLDAFTSALDDALGRQREATAGIVDVARKIQGFVAGIEVVALDLRMLTLNAKLEAARWGTQGAAFATVAAGMRDLTTEVQRVNERVGDLAATLSSQASRIVENEQSMQDLAQRLAQDVAERMGELRRAYEDTRSSTARAVAVGTERAHRMVALSTGMLTNLQFQDRMAQTLREVDVVVSRTGAITSDLMDTRDDGDGGDVSAALREARERAGASVIRISEESELNSSDRHMTAGVVELF